MTAITLEQADRMIAAALQAGVEQGFNPLTVAVLDPGGHLVAFARQAGASTLRPQIALGKAGTALALGVSSRVVAEMAAERSSFIASLGPISPLGVIPAAGGLIVVDENGAITGAIGVTGDTSDNDERCAFAGIVSAGLSAKSKT